MYQLSFITLRAFGFLPFTRPSNSKQYLLSQKWLFWSYILFGINFFASIWRIKFYIFTSETPTYKSFIYDLLITYEPLLNLLYSLVILYSICGKNNLKKLQKCLNLLEEIQLPESNLAQKLIFFYTIFTLLTLTFVVEVTHNLFLIIDNYLLHLDYVVTLLMSFGQSFSLLFNCVIYCALFYRLKNITQKLENILQGHKFQLKNVVESYLTCTTLINTFHNLNFIILRNIWLHSVYDLLCGYQGGEMYLKRYFRGERTNEDAIVDIASSYWNFYNVPLSFFLFNLGNRLRNQVINF